MILYHIAKEIMLYFYFIFVDKIMLYCYRLIAYVS